MRLAVLYAEGRIRKSELKILRFRPPRAPGNKADAAEKIVWARGADAEAQGYGGNPYYYYYFKTHPSALKGSKLAALAPSRAMIPHTARKSASTRRPLRAQQERRRAAAAAFKAAPSLIDTSG